VIKFQTGKKEMPPQCSTRRTVHTQRPLHIQRARLLTVLSHTVVGYLLNMSLWFS